MSRFFEAARADRWAWPLILIATTGMRIGECVALTWADIVEDRTGHPVVTVNKTRSEFQGKPYEGTPKTAAGTRSIPLSEDAISMLNDLRECAVVESGAHGQGVGPMSYVFPSPITGHPMSHDSLRNIMERICTIAKVPKLSPHKLRHTFASVNYAEGRSAGDISAVMGHADISTTQRIYQTSYDEGRRNTALNFSKGKGDMPTTIENATPKLLTSKRPRKGGPRLP